MNVIVGIALLFVCVFGGFVLAGGNLAPILYALPFEMLMIGGAATANFVISNSFSDCKHAVGGLGAALRGTRYRNADYLDLFALLYRLLRVSQTQGAVGLEAHIERPAESSIFTEYPRLAADKGAVTLICDYLRMVGMNANDPFVVDEMMAQELRKIREERLHPAHVFATLADALPALGIVAAVLGVIKTMGAINESPAVLGAMLGSALVGTFLGVLLSYGLVGPIAARMRGVVEEECKFYDVIRAVITAHLQGLAPQVAIEAGRKVAPTALMPSFEAVEGALFPGRN